MKKHTILCTLILSYEDRGDVVLYCENVTEWLLRHTNGSDVVTSGNYSPASLQYYLDRNGAPLKLTWSVSEMLDSKCIFIVVNMLYRENPRLVNASCR